MTPTDFRVTVAGDAGEYRAFLAASDSELDLAFLQLEERPARPLASVDFGALATGRIGDTVRRRLAPVAGFDRAPFFETARIAGRIAKPRGALILDASPALSACRSSTLRGAPVGVVATVLSRVAEADAPRAAT